MLSRFYYLYKNNNMSIFRKLFNKIVGWFDGIPDHIKVYVANSLNITTKIRDALNSPVAIAITALIPTDHDEQIRIGLIKAINTALPYLLIVDSCKEKPSIEEMINCWVEELRKHPKHTQDALLIKLASLLTAMQDNNDLNQNLYDTYTQMGVSKDK